MSTDPAVLSRNVAALAARGVILPEADPDSSRIRLESGPGDAVLSLCAANGRWVRLHSQRDPATEADRLIAPAFESAEPALVIVIGLGLGYALDAVERRSPRTKVLALEPVPASLRHMLSRRDWSAWLTENRLRLLVGPDYSGASDAWKEFDSGASMPPIVVHPVLTREAADAVMRAREMVERIAFGALANINARKRFAGRYLLNTLKNLPVIAREGNAGALFDAFSRVPAIVVSAGPSLDRNIAEVLEFRDRAMVIAVDTALRPLLGAGVDPHLVISVDPSEVNSRHLANLPDPGRTCLVAEGSLGPVVFEQFVGRTFIFKVSHHHPWPWLRELGIERDTLRAWGSVATSAFDLALKMGCDPIIFAGQDLAYTGGQPYCRGTIFEEQWASLVAAGEELPDIWARLLDRRKARILDDVRGHGVVTLPQLVAFRDWIVEQTSILDRRTVINATGGGILHGPGIRQAELGLVLAALPPLRELDARVRECRARTTASAKAESKRTGPHLLAAFTRACAGAELTTWASFANMTPSALSVELDAVAVGVQPRHLVQKQFADVAQDPRPTVSTLESPRVDPHKRTVVQAAERIRVCRAALLDADVPEWARAAAGTIDPFDTPAFQHALDGLPPGWLLRAAERCEAGAAFVHAAALYARLAERWKLDLPREARTVSISWLKCLFWAGDFAAALSLVERAALVPDVFAVGCLSAIHQLTGDQPFAVAKIENLIGAYPDMPDLRLNLAIRLAMSGHLQDALALIDIDRTRWPGRPQPEYARGVCLRVHGDHEAATQALAAIADEFPYAAPELVVASVATGHRAAIERALRAIRRSFQGPVVFLNVPRGQAAVVDAALTRLGGELATQHRQVEVSQLSPVAVRMFTQATDAWKPRWQP